MAAISTTATLALKFLCSAVLLTTRLAADLTDRVLLRLIGQGRQEALEVFYERYKRLIYGLVLRMTGDPRTAEEITLDTFTRVWNNAASYSAARASEKTWLVSLARHRAIDVLRRRDSRPDQKPGYFSAELLESLQDPVDVEEQVGERDLRSRIRNLVRELPREQQEVLLLAYFGGYTHSEIAARLEQPLGTVKTRIRTALSHLKERLADDSAIH